MIVNVYAVKDDKHEYWTPSFEANDETAYRNFAHTILTSKSVMTTFKKDFSLYKIGTYDTSNGLINSCIPELIAHGGEIVE